MSTDFPDEGQNTTGWISQAEAARIHGVTRQAIHKLVRGGRLRSMRIGGHVLVNREDVEGFSPQPAGRPVSDDTRDFERIRALLESCDKATLDKLYEYLRAGRPPHPIETRLGADSEVILEALNRSGELTTRMFRGVIAESAFHVHIVENLTGWRNETIEGNTPYDFLLNDGIGPVRVQVKLQRSAKGKPETRSGYYVVEPQRTRGGKTRGTQGTEEKTRPYRYGDFDILAVSLQPSTGRWDEFRYTIGNWLLPEPKDHTCIKMKQTVSPDPNDDWSGDFLTCVAWFRSGVTKKISDPVGGHRGQEED